MILFIGKAWFEEFSRLSADIKKDIDISSADKIIITCDCDCAVDAVKTAMQKNIAVLAVMDGYKAVAQAFGVSVKEIECESGSQEWTVIDATSPAYLELESVIQVARGGKFAVCEDTMPNELDCMSRAEDGEIVAMRNKTSPKEYGNIYAINFDLFSNLTPDGEQIIKNFINMQ